MTSSMAAALLLRDQILERENEWSPVFAPDRSILHPQLFVNGIESRDKPSDAFSEALSSPGLRTEVESVGAYLGLSLPWLPF